LKKEEKEVALVKVLAAGANFTDSKKRDVALPATFLLIKVEGF
jgi:hypothetical protein